MKTLTIKVTELEYAKVKAYMASTEYLLKNILMNLINNDMETNDDFDDVEVQKKYNDVFVQELSKCGMVLRKEAENKYLFNIK